MSDAREALPAAEDDAVLTEAVRAFYQALRSADPDGWATAESVDMSHWHGPIRAALDAAGVGALRAEVERLRAVSAAQPYETERELAVALDEAQRQLADLRAGIEALAAEYEKPNPSTLAYRSEVARAVRALAGSGEQPGDAHRMIGGSHERPRGPECICGAGWDRPNGPAAGLRGGLRPHPLPKGHAMTTSERQTWRERLDPFAAAYARLTDAVLTMSDDELRKTLAATKRPTQTNSWWAAYRVAPIVADAVRDEQRRRRAEKAMKLKNGDAL